MRRAQVTIVLAPLIEGALDPRSADRGRPGRRRRGRFGRLSVQGVLASGVAGGVVASGEPRLRGGVGVALVAVLGAVAMTSSGLVAQSSPGIAPSEIDVDEPIGQGEEIRLPSPSISNGGAEEAIVIVDVISIDGQEERAPDPTWFRIDPERFRLEGGEGQVVEVRMDVPRDAETGDYRVLRRARAEPANDVTGSGEAVSTAAVASVLTFHVEHRSFGFFDPLVDFFQDRSPFAYLGVSLLGGLLIMSLIRHRVRFRLDIGVERKD